MTPNIAVRAEASYSYMEQLSLNQGTSLYRPAFLMTQLGVAYKFDPSPAWGGPAFQSLPIVTKTAPVLKAPAAPPADPPAAHWTA